MTTQDKNISELSSQQYYQYRLRNRGKVKLTNNLAKLNVKFKVNESQFIQAVKQVSSQQEVLRTLHEPMEGFNVPVQSVTNAPNILLIIDGITIDLDNSITAELYDEHSNIKIEVRNSTESAEVFICIPYVLADKHSLSLLAEQLIAAYDGTERDLGIVQYVDYSQWSREVIADSKMVESGNHWTEIAFNLHKGNLLEKINVGENYNSIDSREKKFVLSEQLTESLRCENPLPQPNEESIFLAAWSYLLSNWTQSDTVLLGYISSCRNLEQIENTVGVFEKSLPLKVSVNSVSAAQFTSSVSEQLLRSRELEHSFDYKVMFNDENSLDYIIPFQFEYRPEVLSNDGYSFEYLSKNESPFRLKLNVDSSADGITLSIKSDEHYLEAEVDILAERYLLILEQLVNKSDLTLDELAIYGDKEFKILSSFEQQVSERALFSVYDDIAQNVDKYANNVAVICNGKELTYSELWSAANDLAIFLRKRGVVEGEYVALVQERSEKSLITLLALWGLGAVPVPIDKDTPTKRVNTIIENANISHLISDVDDLSGVRCNLIGDIEVGGEAEDILPKTIDVNRLALLLHTSGTTGTPNAVPVSQKSISNYIGWAKENYAINSKCNSVWFTSASFDLSITSYLLPLATASYVRIIDDREVVKSLSSELLKSKEPLVIKLTPSHATALVEDLKARNVKIEQLYVLVIGGENLTDQVTHGINDVFTDVTIYNEYGPTEATVGCTSYKCNVNIDTGNVPIGRPIANTNIKILNHENKELAIGVSGQIAVSGLGVTCGYINNEVANESKFIELNGQHTYLTGDRGRVRANGTLEFLGRNDDQVAIRGFRVELGEIERCLNSIEGIELSAAVLGRTKTGRTLVAYYQQKEGGEIDQGIVRRELEQNLPPYMVPLFLIELGSMPLTRNGKIDKKALSSTFIGSKSGTQIYVAPRNQNEEILAAVWMKVFGAEQIGIDDNYFELGGDSVRSVQATALAETRGLRFELHLLHENPTIRELAAAIQLEDNNVELHMTKPFELINKEDRALVASDIDDAYPLNLLQEGMIYHRDFAPKSAVYHAICSYNINMPVDIEAMRSAVKALVQQHPLLRTSFDLSTFSGPMQLVHKEGGSPLGYLDLRTVDSDTHQKYVDEWMEEEKLRGFEIEEYPLIRFMLHQFSDSHCQLSYSFHHEIIDGWSDALMMTELMHRYLSAVNNVPMDFPEPTSSFRDSIYLEQQALKNVKFKEFWLDRMADTNVMKLPNLNKPKADKGHRDIIKFEPPISRELSTSVKELANNLAVPLKTVLLAAHLKVMSLMGGHEDVMTYTVGNGRPENRDGHSLVGLFVNSLAFRQKLSGGSWADLTHDTLNTENELLPYRRYPMAELKRQHGSEPLAETLFFFNHYHITDGLSRWDNAVLNEIKVYAESTFPFCVNAFLTPFEKDICIRIEYDALQYRPDDMHVAGQFYVDVLNAMVEAPYSNYNERHFLSDAMYEQIVDKMSGSEEVDESVANILETISEYEESMSDRLAVADPSSSMTYGELAKYSNGLATNLVNEVGAKCKFIVICMNRSSDLIPTILGVLKAGKAYVPISPDFPNKRIESIVNELDAVILCDEENSKRFLDSAFKTINVTANRASYLNSKGCGPKVDISLSDAAYVIYTSGSTGKPKGVLVNHDCLASTTKARLQYYSLNPNEKHVLVSSSSFDSSIAVIFGALASGAALLVSDDRTIKDSSLLVNFMREQQATSLLSVPSLLATLLDENLDGVKSLKRIISAGETLPKDLAGKLKLSLSADLYNEYGPTEATVWATVFKVDKIPEQANVPIGRPIKGVQVHILDNNMHQVPVAVQGELYIGGAGVADGYVNDTELTSDRFVENPFSDVPGSRLYRTGDIARFNHDGDVEFIGRSDRLVKIQGFRVELTEVEAVLNEHESVEKSIVVVSDDKVGQKYLCAYVLPSNEHKKDIDVQELKDSTKKVLPKYMIPSVIIVMSQLPLTSSGKLDYDHLPSPGRYLIERSSTYIAPTTETEKVIASVWCSVLSAERVGVNDDFIELGGESLAAMKIMAQIRKIYSVSISLGEVFDDVTTVAKVSLKIDSLLHEKVESRADREAETGEL